MKGIHLLITCLICMLSLHGCKKDAQVQKKYIVGSPDQNMLDYGIFKPGTYWVYQDSASGKLDSVWVYHYEETIDTIYKDTDHPKMCRVYLYRSFSSKYRSNNYFQYNSAFDYNNKLSMFLEDVIDSTGFIGEYVNMHLPFVAGKTVSYITDDNCTSIASYPSATFNAHTYNNVLAYHHSRDFSTYYFVNHLSYGNVTNRYMAPHLGLIRKEILDSNIVWNLVRYHIVQ